LILIDTNVLVDLVTDDPLWAEGSQHQLDIAAIQEDLAINDIVYAELSVRYALIEELDAMIPGARLVNATMPRPALFSPARLSNGTALPAVPGQESCPISSLALTPSYPTAS